MASDVDTVAYLFKREYSNDQVGENTLRDHVLMSKVTKKVGLGGEDFRYIVRHGNAQGVSGDFVTAQTGSETSKGKQFATEPSLKYGVITLHGPSMARSRGNTTVFNDMVRNETDSIIEEVGASLAFDAYRTSAGIRGRRASASGNVVTLTVADDVRNFSEGMTVLADDTATGLSPRVGTTKVASVDEDSGTVTLVSAAAIGSFADSDYLFRAGDPGTCMEGLEQHLPLTAPGSGDSFRGVNRSTNVRILAGSRINDTGSSIETNIGRLAVKIANNGKRADAGFINPVNYLDVVNRRDAKVMYDGGGGEADVGFQYVVVHTPAGAIKLYSDPDCPVNLGYVGKLSDLFFRHLEDWVHVIRDDGKPSMRQTSADGIEMRIRNMSQPILRLPGSWGVLAI